MFGSGIEGLGVRAVGLALVLGCSMLKSRYKPVLYLNGFLRNIVPVLHHTVLEG